MNTNLEPLGKRNGRRQWRTLIDRTCGRCKQPISSGERVVLDVSKTAHHPVCVNIGLVVGNPNPRPKRINPALGTTYTPIGKTCELCLDEIEYGERAVHIDGQPRHHECQVRHRQK